MAGSAATCLETKLGSPRRSVAISNFHGMTPFPIDTHTLACMRTQSRCFTKKLYLLTDTPSHPHSGGHWWPTLHASTDRNRPASKGLLGNSSEYAFRVSFDKFKWEMVQEGEDKGRWKKTDKIVKVFGWFPSPMTFLQNLGKHGAATWGYEYQTAGQPCKFAIDFDLSATVIGADALVKAEYLGHSAICQLEKELRVGLKRLLGMEQIEVYVWKGSRFKTATTLKHSYHLVVANLRASVIEYFKHLIKNLWPNGFLVGEGTDAVDAIDMKIYDGGRQFRAPMCAKLESPGDPLYLITRSPFGPDVDLSRTALPDPDFKASMRSLITVIDPDNSTLLDTTRLNMGMLNHKTKSKPGKRKRDGETRPKVAPPPPHISDTSTGIVPGKTDELALMLVRIHPQLGSGHYEWLRTLCVILNEDGCHSEAELLAVEYSRIRERYKGVADVESQFRGLQERGSGGIKVWMATLAMWANEHPALIFNTIENSSGLGHVEGVGVNKVWANKLDQMLRWANTARTSGKWLVQCVSYIEPRAKVQMRVWIKQYYTQVEDAEFETIWCIETRSEYYENAFKDYILSKLKGLGWRFKDTSASQGFKGLGSLTEEAPATGASVAITNAPGTCHSSSLEPVTADAAARPSPAAVAITTAPVTNTDCGVESVCTEGGVVVDEAFKVDDESTFRWSHTPVCL